jgi:hypothetical protein
MAQAHGVAVTIGAGIGSFPFAHDGPIVAPNAACMA